MFTGCNNDQFQSPPFNEFKKVGLYGHGEGILGDMNINFYEFERQCDSCHSPSSNSHAELGTCGNCHQPSEDGWSHSLVAKNHNDFMPIIETDYHGKLPCVECHINMSNVEKFKEVSCNHCHNHSPADIRYAHELMNNYKHDTFNINNNCISCHTVLGTQFRKYYDPITKELN
jgi:hypothetical protein